MESPDLMAYAYARLRAEDESRSDALDHDPRVWTPDPDEADAPHVCAICDAELADPRAKLCPDCRDAGWCPTPCKGCGGKLRDLDRRWKRKDRRGYCQACRASMPQVRRGGNSRPVTEAA